MFCAIADEENEVFGIADVVFQVVADPACLAHARCADDDGRVGERIQFHGLFHFSDISQVIHSKRIRFFPKERVGLLVEAFGMEPIDFRGIHAQGAVDKDWNLGDYSFLAQLVQLIHHLLGSSNGERGNDDFTSLFQRLLKQASCFRFCVRLECMESASVGAFDLEKIDILDGLGVAQDIIVATSDISTEQEAEGTVVFRYIEDDLGGAEDVTGIGESEADTVADGNGAVIVDGNELADSVFGFGGGIERLNRGKTLFGAFLGNEFGVMDLDIGGIFEHDTGEVTRGGGAVDMAVKAVVAKVGEVSAMIDMGVAENDGVNFGGFEWEIAVAFDTFPAPSLEEAAFQHQFAAVDFHQIHGSCRRAGGSKKVNLHFRRKRCGRDVVSLIALSGPRVSRMSRCNRNRNWKNWKVCR